MLQPAHRLDDIAQRDRLLQPHHTGEFVRDHVRIVTRQEKERDVAPGERLRDREPGTTSSKVQIEHNGIGRPFIKKLQRVLSKLFSVLSICYKDPASEILFDYLLHSGQFLVHVGDKLQLV